MKAFALSSTREYSLTITRKQLYSVLLIVFSWLCLGWSVTAQPAQITTSSENGLSVVQAYTKSGRIKIKLPANIHARDRISGTVVAEPDGKNSRQVEKNTAYLQGCVVEIEGQSPDSKGGAVLNFVAPAATVAMATIRDGRGKTVGRFRIPVDPSPRVRAPLSDGQPQFDIPTVGEPGRPLTIPGAADGDLTNSVVRIGEIYYQPVAESPDGMIIIPETDLIPGNIPIQAMDGGPWVYGNINLINLQLSAGKLNLVRGERTDLRVVVSGLSGLSEPVTLRLINETPGYIRLRGGNEQEVDIIPQAVAPDGYYHYSDLITGITPGNFSISAAVDPAVDQSVTETDSADGDTATSLREEATSLERQADQLAAGGQHTAAESLRRQAQRLRQQAANQDWDWSGATEQENPASEGSSETTRPTAPQRPGNSAPLPVPLQDGSKSQPVGEEKKECDCNEVSKNQVYSRGNNDQAQLEKQFKNSGNKGYQYQTARMELALSGKPGESCACENNKCEGEWMLTLDMQIKDLLDPKDQDPIPDPTDFALLDGVAVNKGTTRCDQKVPAPNVKTTSEQSKFPAVRAANKFVQPNARKRDYKAAARVKVPCKPGTYHYRFLIAHNTFPGGNKTPGTSFGLPVLNAYVDVTVTITEEAVCEQKVQLEAHYLEFIAQYSWHAKGGAELPEVDYDIPGLEDTGTGQPAPKGKTRNIAKLFEEDGNKVDDPFPERK